MAKLFAIDAQARDENMNFAARHALPMERAPSVLSELKAQIKAASRTALPSSPLGKASSYTLRLWHKLTRFLDYAELELSNNLAENSMRPVAIGRRNWTHIGHEKAGPRVAAILSIVETCRRLKIPARPPPGASASRSHRATVAARAAPAIPTRHTSSSTGKTSAD
jgi:hypothetical protein